MSTMEQLLAAIKADPAVLAKVAEAVNDGTDEAPPVKARGKAPVPKPKGDTRATTFVGWIHTLAKANLNSAGKAYSKGVHSRFSGIMDVACGEFGVDRESMIALVRGWADKGLIQQHPTRGGFMLYGPGEMPTGTVDREARAREVLGL